MTIRLIICCIRFANNNGKKNVFGYQEKIGKIVNWSLK